MSAQQENRPKIFDRIPARVLPNAQAPQTKLEKNQLPMDTNADSTENIVDDDTNKKPEVLSSSLCDIPEAERLSYVMTSLNDSIQKSTLPEVNYIV